MIQTRQLGNLIDDMQQAEGPDVLIAYATRYGSTTGIAERITSTLRDAGIRVSLQRADKVDTVSEYNAVVFGSPVYDQRWLPAGDRFVQRNLAALAQRPVWLFSVGSFGDRKRIVGPLMRREPKDIDKLQATIRPRDYRVFAGVIDPSGWPLFARVLYRVLGGRFGDNRDWRDIEDWARGIAAVLHAATPR
jgi:menaquinone-dependent protoporphyrinogen oxidase